MENYINHNGKIFTSDTPLFTSRNRAFSYGDGLFESMRFHDKKILFFDAHFARLKQGLDLLKMSPAKGIHKNYITEACKELAEKNKIKKDGRIRLQFYRNEGGFYAPLSSEASFILSISPIEDSSYRLNERGLRIGVFDTIKKSKNILSCLKTSAAMLYVMAGLSAREKDVDECIILNEDGGISETTKSNIFMVKQGIFYTPPLSDAGLPGIMRNQLIEILREEGKQIVERSILPSEIKSFDEIFLSNAILGIEWVMGYESKRFYHKHADWLIKKLNQKVKEVSI